MTEFELIYRYFKQQSNEIIDAVHFADTPIVRGLGDDAAVIDFNKASKFVTCVDTMVQGRHFSDDWQQVNELAFAIGFKSVVVNISDIAAMGATPHSILLALALPQRLANETWLGSFAQGLFHACKQYGVQLIGGDTTRNDKLVISVTANGVIAKALNPIYRNGAKVGDKVYVSGTLGDACYALHHADTKVGQRLAHRLHMPTPRIKLGQALAKQGKATAMIDISDGLVQDLNHICLQSGVAMRLNLAALPSSELMQSVVIDERLRCQLTGGDDYELAFTLPASVLSPNDDKKMSGLINTQVTCIGEVIDVKEAKHIQDGLNIELIYQGAHVTKEAPYPFSELPNLTGYQHFSGNG